VEGVAEEEVQRVTWLFRRLIFLVFTFRGGLVGLWRLNIWNLARRVADICAEQTLVDQSHQPARLLLHETIQKMQELLRINLLCANLFPDIDNILNMLVHFGVELLGLLVR
jgi:hypothetical protein